jgi:MFS family permease
MVLKTDDATVVGEMREGWRYIKHRPGLFAFLMFFTVTNFALAITHVLITPMVLSFASPLVLSRILSAFGLGLVLSGLFMSIWKGPAQRVRVVLAVAFLQGIGVAACGLHQSAWLIGAGLCLVGLGLPVVNSCTQAVWQTKTPAEIQGRVFAVRRMLVQAAAPVAYIIAGPLADRVVGPLMAPRGAWAGSVGALIGVGANRGMAVLFLIAGAIVMLSAVGGGLTTPLRHLESRVPDAVPDLPPVIDDELQPMAAAASAS